MSCTPFEKKIFFYYNRTSILNNTNKRTDAYI